MFQQTGKVFAGHGLPQRSCVAESGPTLCPEKKNQNFGVPTQDKALKLFQSRGGSQAAAGISRPSEYLRPCRARSGSATAQPQPVPGPAAHGPALPAPGLPG